METMTGSCRWCPLPCSATDSAKPRHNIILSWPNHFRSISLLGGEFACSIYGMLIHILWEF